jgi:hypothetical protein
MVYKNKLTLATPEQIEDAKKIAGAFIAENGFYTDAKSVARSAVLEYILYTQGLAARENKLN